MQFNTLIFSSASSPPGKQRQPAAKGQSADPMRDATIKNLHFARTLIHTRGTDTTQRIPDMYIVVGIFAIARDILPWGGARSLCVHDTDVWRCLCVRVRYIVFKCVYICVWMKNRGPVRDRDRRLRVSWLVASYWRDSFLEQTVEQVSWTNFGFGSTSRSRIAVFRLVCVCVCVCLFYTVKSTSRSVWVSVWVNVCSSSI